MIAPEMVLNSNQERAVAFMSEPVSEPVHALDDRRLCELVDAIARDRDKNAFAELFRHFAPKLKAYSMRAGADAQSADEVAQEAMISLWRKAHTFDRSKASVSTWLFTIVRNKRIDMLRREARPDLTENDFIHIEKASVSAAELAEGEQTGKLLRAGLKELPDEQATVLRLAYFHDKSHRRIAEELELPLGTVKSRIRLALARLKVDLAETLS